jgi:hypothetical protein
MSRKTDSAVAMAALALALALPATARASDATCTLSLTAEPSVLVIGRDERARIRIAAPADEPRLAASVGRIEGLHAEASGVFSAEYLPPRQGFPQVAVIAARVGTDCGWTAIRLVGVGEAVVRSHPHAEITLRIADRTFGPVRADRNGKAVVPIEVPPGVTHALHGDQQIPLGLPPSRHLAGLAQPTVVRADVESSVDVLLVASTDDGAPRAGAQVTWKASLGALSPPEPAGPGTFRARWTLPPSAVGTATLAVALEQEKPVVMSVERRAGPVATLTISLDRTRIAADEGSPLSVRVALRDAAGNPADDEVRVSATLGRPGPAMRVEPGRYEAVITVPHELSGRSDLVVSAAAGNARGEARIALVPAPPAHIALEASSEILASGRDASELRVRTATSRRATSRWATRPQGP